MSNNVEELNAESRPNSRILIKAITDTVNEHAIGKCTLCEIIGALEVIKASYIAQVVEHEQK
jgi:hypothetical protein